MIAHYSFFLVMFIPALINAFGYFAKQRILEKLSWIVLLILVSTRYDIGGDYSTYYIIFNKIGGGEYFYLNEPLFYLLNKIVYELGFHFNLVIFFIDAFSFYIYYRFFNSLEGRLNRHIAFVLFVTFYSALWANMIYIRQEIAVAFLILALKSLVERDNKFSFFIYVIVATLFHNVSIIFLSFLYIKRFNLKYIFIFCIFFTLSIIFLLNFKELIMLLNYYEYINNIQTPPLGIGFLIKVSVFIFLLSFYKYYKNNAYYKLSVLGSFMGLNVFLLPILFRMESFFILFYIYGLVLLISKFTLSSKIILFTLLVTYNILAFNKVVVSSADYFFWDRYKIIFFTEDLLKNEYDRYDYRRSLQ